MKRMNINYSKLEISFVTFNELFLEMSYRWLQDNELLYLIDGTPITKDQQLLWFEKLSILNDYEIYGVMGNGIPIGVCGLKHITKYDGEYFGYIGEKDYWGIGIGKYLIEYIEKIAKIKQLESIYLKVREDNVRAIKLYKKMNYQIISQDGYTIKMNKTL